MQAVDRQPPLLAVDFWIKPSDEFIAMQDRQAEIAILALVFWGIGFELDFEIKQF